MQNCVHVSSHEEVSLQIWLGRIQTHCQKIRLVLLAGSDGCVPVSVLLSRAEMEEILDPQRKSHKGSSDVSNHFTWFREIALTYT